MSKIIDYKSQIQETFDRIVSLNNEISYNWDYESDVKKRIIQETPTIMFYGVYNAGKSTLLNAIFGEEVASVADVPETHEVTAYSWNGYELYDTPGINGPEKDYVISKAELIKHDIVLFMVDDSDSFDNRLVSEEIVQVFERGKSLILVMNNKQTLDGESDEDGIAKRGKLFHNIEKAAEYKGITNILEELSFMMIDADAALHARLTNKKLLIQDSKIEELEYLILRKMKEQDGFKFLLPPIQMIEQHLMNVQTHLSNQLSSEDEKKLNNLISDLREHKVLLLRNVKSKINTKLELTKNIVYNKLLNEQPVEEDMEKCNQEIEELIDIELKQATENVEMDISDFLLKIDQNNIADLNFIMQGSPSLSDMSNHLRDTSGISEEIATTLLRNQIIADSAKKILAKQIIIPKIPTPIPIVNVVLIAMTIIDVISILNKKKQERERLEKQVDAANAEQEEQVYRRTQAIQQLKSQLDAEFFRIEEKVIIEVDEILNEVFVQYIKQVEDEVQLKKNESERINNYLYRVNKLHQEIEGIKLQITI